MDAKKQNDRRPLKKTQFPAKNSRLGVDGTAHWV
jgi:hypothetical protein